MCGFAGIFSTDATRFAARPLEEMATAMRHRGPDDRGFCAITLNDGVGAIDRDGAHVAFAFNRLSIVDTSPAGHQPMTDEAKRVALVFNGELYNAPELRPDLERRGHRFRGHSDTE